jgi:hypothetical protein
MSYIGLDGDVQVKVASAGSYVSWGRVIDAEQRADDEFEQAGGVGQASEPIYQMIEPKTTIESYIQNTMPAHALRAAINALPQSLDAIDVGLPGVTSAFTSHTTCYINSVKLSCEKGGAAKASYEILGLTATNSALTAAATALASGLICEWFAATIKFGGVEFCCNSWESELNNNLALETNMDAGTENYLRQPKGIKPGDMKVTFQAEFQTPVTVSMNADRPGTVEFVANLGRATGDVLTHTVTNLRVKGDPIKVSEGAGDVTWQITCEASDNDISAWDFG